MSGPVVTDPDAGRPASSVARALRHAGVLVIVGLLVELATLFGGGATSFLAFALVGVVLVAAGIVRYLVTVLRTQPG